MHSFIHNCGSLSQILIKIIFDNELTDTCLEAAVGETRSIEVFVSPK